MDRRSGERAALRRDEEARRRRPPAGAVVAFLAAVVAQASGCAKPPPIQMPPPITIAAPPEAKVKTRMTIAASAEANPDGAGRPSPIVVRVYQLRTDAAFAAASFDDLFERDDKVLGSELVTRDEYVLAPKESRTIDVLLADEARFVGAVAGFRDILNAEWRVLAPVPKGSLSVAVERTRLVLTATE